MSADQSRTVIVHQLPLDVSDAEIITLMRQAKKARDANAPTVTCQFMGYTEDSRELPEIPEVRNLCKRLVRLGYIAFLDPMTTSRDHSEWFNHGASFGAFEVWRMSHDKLMPVGQPFTVESHEIEKFLQKDLAYANTMADDHLSREV